MNRTRLATPPPPVICNLDGQPFISFDAAAKMRDLLINETGRPYQIDPVDGALGLGRSTDFVVVAKNRAPAETRQDGVSNNNVFSVTDAPPIQPKAYRQSLRTWILQIPLLLLSQALILFPLDIWAGVLKLLYIPSLPAGINSATLLNATQWLGLAVLAFILITLAVPYFGVQLLIDQTGVTLKQGIIAQDTIKIRYSDIRTVGMKQGVFDRILNIGTLELASAGSDGVDIRFHHLADPATVRDTIQSSINRHH